MQRTVRFTLRLVRELNLLIENEAQAKGFSKTGLITQILWDYVKEKEQKEATKNKQKHITNKY